MADYPNTSDAHDMDFFVWDSGSSRTVLTRRTYNESGKNYLSFNYEVIPHGTERWIELKAELELGAGPL